MTAPTVKVKPLVWDGDEAEDHDLTTQPDPYHRYTVRKLGETRFDVILNHELGSLWFKIVKGQVWTDYASAKAAAQADYEARILSAIDTTDLEALIGAVLAEAATLTHRIADGYSASGDAAIASGLYIAEGGILALRPDAMQALERARREARVEGMRIAADAVPIPPMENNPSEFAAGARHGMIQARDYIRALIAAEERGESSDPAR